jgi:3-dehydroshikimate dehydratase
MFLPGLVSVTFRKLTPEKIIDLVQEAGLFGIEWGGDIHVPHGDLGIAAEVRRRTEDAGLQVCAYGSYYRSVNVDGAPEPFEPVLESALALGAPVIRVWPGQCGSGEADTAYRKSVADNLRRVGETARESGVTIALEYHGGTLTDTTESALTLMAEIDHSNVKLYWQPPHGLSIEERIEGLKAIHPYLSYIHAFHWEFHDGKIQRQPLSTGAGAWRAYLDTIAELDGDQFVLLEFVRDDSPEQFLQDARALKQLLAV